MKGRVTALLRLFGITHSTTKRNMTEEFRENHLIGFFIMDEVRSVLVGMKAGWVTN